MKIYLQKRRDGISFHIMHYALTTPQSKTAFLKRAQIVMQNHGVSTAYAEVYGENINDLRNTFKLDIVSLTGFAMKVSEGIL